MLSEPRSTRFLEVPASQCSKSSITPLKIEREKNICMNTMNRTISYNHTSLLSFRTFTFNCRVTVSVMNYKIALNPHRCPQSSYFNAGNKIKMIDHVTLLIVSLLPLLTTVHSARDFKTVEDYMNVCILGMNHKTTPSEEKDLANEFCSPWTERSCCNKTTSQGIQEPNWLNFDIDHCGQLSPQCREHFLMDMCFYECSPNVGPWVVEDIRKIRKERFVNVPLCQKPCTNWWEACKNDLTCIGNWARDFEWHTGINTCPKDKKCRPFHEIFDGPYDFCEQVMNFSFKVVSDDEDCFTPWFDYRKGNPNTEVAKRKASELLGVTYVPPRNGLDGLQVYSVLLLLPFCLYFL